MLSASRSTKYVDKVVKKTRVVVTEDNNEENKKSCRSNVKKNKKAICITAKKNMFWGKKHNLFSAYSYNFFIC